jgi:hypothetical protein
MKRKDFWSYDPADTPSWETEDFGESVDDDQGVLEVIMS